VARVKLNESEKTKPAIIATSTVNKTIAAERLFNISLFSKKLATVIVAIRLALQSE
jgi:hypothetical protein